MPAECHLYTDLAHLFRLLTPPEDYVEEAAFWREVLRGRLGPGRHQILELGVGGGHNLSHLTADFDATAVDLSEAMLEQCRRLNPGVELLVGDMRSVRLQRVFDAVLIHDAIGSMTTQADLTAAFVTAATHLRPGGVFITSPDFFLEDFREPAVDTATHSEGETSLTYFEYVWDPDPSDTSVEAVLTYLIRDRAGLRIEHDRLVMGLFPKAIWIHLMTDVGFHVSEQTFPHSSGRPYTLLVGQAPD